MSAYLPEELIPNILARLPIDAVLRCTSVCKSWYSLITSPSFISSHLNLSIPNQEPRLLIKFYTNKERFSLHRDNQTFDEIANFDFPFPSGNWFYNVIATLNGLFCLSYRMETLILWNPSLRKSILLPKPRNLFHSHGSYDQSIGFGFLPATNEYKIVRVSYLELLSGAVAKVPPEVEIYELSTGSWRGVNAGDFSYVMRDSTPHAFLKGIVHWDAYNPNKVGGTFMRLIASFDMTSEKFESLMLPNCLQSDSCLLRVSTFRESLCLIHFRDKFLSIWVMKEYGVADSWTRQLNIDAGQYRFISPLYFRENGDILFMNECDDEDGNKNARIEEDF